MMNHEQENPAETDTYTQDLSMREIMTFAKLRSKRLLLRAGFSLIFLLLVLLLIYAFSPRTATWNRDIMILLPKTDNQIQYPSGSIFSAADLLSTPVMQEVYQNNNLKNRIDFSDFRSTFFIAGNNMKRAFLDAEYRGKMAKKNLTVIDLQNLEREYKQELLALSTEQLTISMIPENAMSKTEITKILNEIPETWYRIYSKLEAKKFPQIDLSTMRQEILQASKQPGRLILLDKTRVYCDQLLKICSTLNEMLQGKNISLPSGEFLGDIQQQLRDLQQYKIAVFHQYILMNSAYQGVFDKIFIYSKLQNIDQELMKINKKYEGTFTAIKLLQTPTSSIEEKKAAPSGTEIQTPVTFQLDNSFFAQFAEMVRNDINNTLRATSAKKILEYTDNRAELEAGKLYFQNLLSTVGNNKQTEVTLKPEQFNSLLQEMYSELFAVGSKVVQFRDKILNEYLTSRTFYAQLGNVQYCSEFRFPVVRIYLGLFGIWIAINLVWGICDFWLMNTKGLLRKE